VCRLEASKFLLCSMMVMNVATLCLIEAYHPPIKLVLIYWYIKRKPVYIDCLEN
jgi:hypothetical protein